MTGALAPADRWRRSLAAVVSLDFVLSPFLGARFAQHPALEGDPWVRMVGSPLAWALGTTGVVALLAFGARRGRWWAAAIALAAGFPLQEGIGRAAGVYFEPMHQTGGVLLGWLAGAALGRLILGPGATSEQRERAAATGALAVLAAGYVNAGLSKVAQSGLAWATTPSHVRLMILAHLPATGGGSVADVGRAIAASGEAGAAIATVALLTELGAFSLLLGSRARMLWSVLLLAFHGGLYATTGILFTGGATLLIAFGFPWDRWLARVALRLAHDVRSLRAARTLAIVVVTGAALWLGLSARVQHHMPGPLFVLACALAAAAQLPWTRSGSADGLPVSEPLPVLPRRVAWVGATILALLSTLWLAGVVPRSHPDDAARAHERATHGRR